MGKIEAEACINHFSHSHPLNLVSIQSSPAKRIICSACTKEASGLVYICETCSYCLHKPCSTMPQSYKHEADKKHALILLPAPAYPEGAFKCNACGGLGTGFCYHCDECELDLHPVCAFMRPLVKGGAHDHPLKLCFEPPHEEKAFLCDVCGESGSNHWLYRCDPCGFDAHLKCGKAPRILQNRQPQMKQSHQSNSRTEKSPQNHQMNKSRSLDFPTSSWSQTDHYFRPIYHQPQGGITITTETYPPFRSQSSRELQMYGGAPPTPGYVQRPRRNDVVQNCVGSFLEGVFEGVGGELVQAFLEGASGN